MKMGPSVPQASPPSGHVLYSAIDLGTSSSCLPDLNFLSQFVLEIAGGGPKVAKIPHWGS